MHKPKFFLFFSHLKKTRWPKAWYLSLHIREHSPSSLIIRESFILFSGVEIEKISNVEIQSIPSESNTWRIIGGGPTKIEQYPYVASCSLHYILFVICFWNYNTISYGSCTHFYIVVIWFN